MKLIKNLIVNIVICAVLLYVFNYYGLGIKIEFAQSTKSLVELIWIFLVLWWIFWVFNSPIKWILKTLSFPVNMISFWLVSLIINVVVFYLFAYIANSFFDWELVVKLGQIWQTLILSFIMTLWFSILKKIL